MFPLLVISLATMALCEVANPCHFTAYETIPIPKMRECLNTIELDPVEQAQTMSAVESYIKMGVFEEYYLDKTFMEKMGQTMIDINPKLKEIREKKYTNAYDFHWDLARTLHLLKDPHAVYVAPRCFTRFYTILPFSVNSRAVEGRQELYLNSLPSTYSFATIQYLKNWEGDDQTKRTLFDLATSNEKIESLSYHRSNGQRVWSDPIQGLIEWTDKYMYISRSRSSRINRALGRDFWLHSTDLGLPDTEVWVKINGVEYHLPWMVVPTISVGSKDDLLSFCPLVALDESVSTSQNMTRTSDIDTEAPMRRMMREQEMPPAPISNMAGLGQAVNGEEKKGSLERLYTGDEVSLYYYSQSDESEDILDAMIIHIPSFMPDDPDQFIVDLQNILTSLVPIPVQGQMPRHAKYLVVDLRGNGGGYVHLGTILMYYLFPHLARPTSGLYQRKKNDLNSLLVDVGMVDDDEPLYEFMSHSVPKHNSDFYTLSKYEKTRNIAGSDVKYMYDYTFGAPDFFALTGALRQDKGDTFKANLPWNSHEIIHLHEGLCGSTCATFALHAAESNAGVFVGLGGLLDAHLSGDIEDPLTVGSFAGGSVLDSQYIEQVVAAYGVQGDSAVPKRFPRNNYIRYPENGLMSWIDDSVPLEFKLISPKITIPYWPEPTGRSAETDLSIVLDVVLPYLVSTGTVNEHSYDSSTTGCDPHVPNAVGGHLLEADGKTNKPECVVVYCDSLSYPSKRDEKGYITECTRTPVTIFPTDPWGGVVIGFSVVMVAVMIGTFIFWAIQFRRGKKFGYKVAEKPDLAALIAEQDDADHKTDESSTDESGQ